MAQYQKSDVVVAVQVTSEMGVVTVVERDRFRRTAQVGEWLVTASDGEQRIIDDETFRASHKERSQEAPTITVDAALLAAALGVDEAGLRRLLDDRVAASAAREPVR